ncbi:hypothetical protein D0T50_00405 [Bacteroides sp. 214]|nr:hypothetical protein [Bacteroides sp. 214]
MIVQGFIEELHIKQLISNNFTNELNSDEIQLIDKSNVSSSVLFILEITELQIKKKKAILSARHFSINNKPTVIVTAKFRKKNKRWIYHSTSLETIKW